MAFRNWVCLGLVLTMASSSAVMAQEKGKGKKKAGQALPVFAIPAEIKLSEEQTAKVEELKKSEGPKVAELQKKLDDLLTADQKAARKEAMAKAKADGKKGKEAQAAVEEALKLNDEQKKQRSELQAEMSKLQLSIKQQIHGLLTDEQKSHYKLPKKAR